MKFLIDECLSPELAMDARNRGFPESTHVTWLGLGSSEDWSIVRRAVHEGYVLVTNNAMDFKRLIGREDIHAGLVCLNVATNVMSLAGRPSRTLDRSAVGLRSSYEHALHAEAETHSP